MIADIRITSISLLVFTVPLFLTVLFEPAERKQTEDGSLKITAVSDCINPVDSDLKSEVQNKMLPPVLLDSDSPDTVPLVERMRSHRVPGVSIAIIHNGQIHWSAGYGVYRNGSSEPITCRSLFQAASLSKPVTASGVMLIAEKGMLQLDEDVNRYLSSWKLPNERDFETEPITPRRLLNHTAGMSVHGFPGYDASSSELPSLTEVLDGRGAVNSGPVRAIHPPGTEWRYSGGGYTVLQQALEDLTELPFEKWMKEVLFDSLGMQNSTFAQPLPDSFADYAASGHLYGDLGIEGGWNHYPEKAAAGLWTTPTDLALWIIEIQSALNNQNSIFGLDQIQEMFTPGMNGWGLGIQIAGEGDSLYFSHSGANAGFRAYMVGFPHTGQGAVVMTNSDRGTPLIHEIIRTIAYYYEWPQLQPVILTSDES